MVQYQTATTGKLIYDKFTKWRSSNILFMYEVSTDINTILHTFIQICIDT